MTPLRPICFMVMPYGVRDTGVQDSTAPLKVDFDALYDRALRPAIEDAGYTPVRADHDASPLIVVDMLERLTLCDLVVADLSIHNGNVYYEIGVRHATEKHNCVLIAAAWARPLFDLQQIRQCRYPLPAGTLSDAEYAAVRKAVRAGIETFHAEPSPVKRVHEQALRDLRATTFGELMQQLGRFQAELRALQVELDPARRQSKLREIVARHTQAAPGTPMLRSVAHELLLAIRDQLDWNELIAFIGKLPKEQREWGFVREQYALALSKTGAYSEAIVALEHLIADQGESSERRGLLGGCFKKLYDASQKAGTPAKAHLASAIKNYELGMMLDLNDYYPSCNLPRLYRERGGPGDAERAEHTAQVVVAACERARRRSSTDEWLRPTLLGAAFDAGDAREAGELADAIEQEGPAAWKLSTTLSDLERSLEQQSDAETRAALVPIYERLKRLVK